MTLPDRPAYEDLELRAQEDWDDVPRRVGLGNAYMLGWRPRRRERARRSHLGAIVIVVAVLALIAAVLLVTQWRNDDNSEAAFHDVRGNLGRAGHPAIRGTRPDLAHAAGNHRGASSVRHAAEYLRVPGAHGAAVGRDDHRADRDAVFQVTRVSGLISGTSTWYCGHGSPCTRGYGPSDLVAAIDPTLGIAKGELVTVRHGSGECGEGARCVTVRIVDVCQCGGRRIIDLTSGAFSRLAPLSRGVIPVELELAAPLPTLPNTATGDAP